MRKEDTVRLNTHVVRDRIEALELKQWWLARQIGVTPKTINRWVSGKVKHIARYNAERLCEALECRLDEIIVRDENDVYATREEQRVAAELLQERDLILLLSPSDNWELAESLIKATMQPNLPLRQLAQLYNLLSITTWRQGSYDEGREHAERAREIGERVGDPGIVHKAICNLATVESLVGNARRALDSYEWCLEHHEGFATARDHAAALSNVGSMYAEFGRFDEAMVRQQEAIAIYERLDLPFNLAIAWVSVALAAIEIGAGDVAAHALDRGEENATRARYEKGLAEILVFRAELLALRGRASDGLPLVEEGLRRLARFEVFNLMCHESAARVHRLAGDYGSARARLDIGLAASVHYPYLHAMMLRECARLALAEGDRAEEARCRERANAIFAEIGMDLRVDHAPTREYGITFTGPDRATG